jgi:hypothetical protein
MYYLSFFPLTVDDLPTLAGIDPCLDQFLMSTDVALLLRVTASLAASEAVFAEAHERWAQAIVK